MTKASGDGGSMIDLHLHLDGALSVDTAIALAKMQKVTLPTYDRTELLHLLQAPDDCRDLNEYLERFDLPVLLMQTKETISEAVYRVQEVLKEDGLIYAELRFAPQQHTRNGLTQEEVVLAALEGLHRSDFHANLILCCMRMQHNQAENMETIRLVHKYAGEGVVAADLAGAEALYPTEDFAAVFQYAGEIGVNFVIHAGEAAGADSVKAAMDFGAKRIGHGIHVLEDMSVMAELHDKKIPLEICVTSNLQTKAVQKLADYPLRKLMDAGVLVTLNTDNPTVSNTTICREFKLVQNQLGFQMEELKRMVFYAASCSFADAAWKELFKRQIAEGFESWIKS